MDKEVKNLKQWSTKRSHRLITIDTSGASLLKTNCRPSPPIPSFMTSSPPSLHKVYFSGFPLKNFWEGNQRNRLNVMKVPIPRFYQIGQ